MHQKQHSAVMLFVVVLYYQLICWSCVGCLFSLCRFCLLCIFSLLLSLIVFLNTFIFDACSLINLLMCPRQNKTTKPSIYFEILYHYFISFYSCINLFSMYLHWHVFIVLVFSVFLSYLFSVLSKFTHFCWFVCLFDSVVCCLLGVLFPLCQ